MAIIRSVSITEEHENLRIREGISLSQVLRAALDQIHKYKTGELLEDNASLMAKIKRLTEEHQKFFKFLDDKGLFNEYHGLVEQKIE